MKSEKTAKKKRKWIGSAVIVAVLVIVLFVFFKFYFVLGVGVKAGVLNQVVYKGYVFKTYEGKLIQAGYRSNPKSGGQTSIQSYEFEFSVTDKSIAETLMSSGGKDVELRYKEYLGAAPWRGYSKYVVYEIVNMKD